MRRNFCLRGCGVSQNAFAGFWGISLSLIFLSPSNNLSDTLLDSWVPRLPGAHGLSLDLQPGKQSETYLHVYDAGAEENIETREYLPGDPCTSHSGETPINEGFVHFQPGLVYNGELDRLHHSFSSISAKVTIMRME